MTMFGYFIFISATVIGICLVMYILIYLQRNNFPKDWISSWTLQTNKILVAASFAFIVFWILQ